VFLRLVTGGKKRKASRYGTHIVSRSGLAYEESRTRPRIPAGSRVDDRKH